MHDYIILPMSPTRRYKFLAVPCTVWYMAVRERFELSRRETPTYRFSKPAPSATWVPHRVFNCIMGVEVGFLLAPTRSRGATHRKLQVFASDSRPSNLFIIFRLRSPYSLGGGGGIRTHDTVAGMAVFKTAAFNHSATPP